MEAGDKIRNMSITGKNGKEGWRRGKERGGGIPTAFFVGCR